MMATKELQLTSSGFLPSQNGVLAGLSDADAALLAPHLQSITLARGRTLQRQSWPIEFVYFVEQGVTCLVADPRSARSVKVGIIGREGVVGFDAAMGATRAYFETAVFVPGAARRIEAGAFQKLLEESPTMRARVLQFAHALSTQAMSTARANARMTLDQRLVRLLLMLHDRVDGDEVALTHECLSSLLGVRRAGVSVAAKKLEDAGIISMQRGAVVVRQRAKLEAISAGGYGRHERLERASAAGEERI